MKILPLAIGKRHDPAIAEAIEDYSKRLGKYATVSWQLAIAKQPTPEAESALLEQYIKSDDVVILLDERGKQLSSPELAGLVEAHEQQATPRLVFVIGGAHGVTQAFRNRAARVWLLSNLVFPHQLVRLILAEQLYRAFTIARGEKYHHS
jgi:23S rRNA (pseudouridine1915-N3)-methyltransferase